jgi:FkbM family methyltransferase
MGKINFNNLESSHIPEILKEVYLDRIYQAVLHNRKGLTIVDVGANIGLTSIYFAQFGKVIAVEPCKEHLEYLKQNIIDNNQAENIKVYPYALSTHRGKAFLNHANNPTMNSLATITSNGEVEEVDSITIEDIINTEKIENIDLLKLDVEGTESELIVSEAFVRSYRRASLLDCNE